MPNRLPIRIVKGAYVLGNLGTPLEIVKGLVFANEHSHIRNGEGVMATRTRLNAARNPDKKAAFSVRIAKSMRKALEAEAEKAGRSLAQEIELRLKETLDQDAGRRAFYGGPELDNLFSFMAHVASHVQARTGQLMFRDWATWRATVRGWQRLLDLRQPKASGPIVGLSAALAALDPGEAPKPPQRPASEADLDVWEGAIEEWQAKSERFAEALKSAQSYVDDLERYATEAAEVAVTLPVRTFEYG